LYDCVRLPSRGIRVKTP